jgi:hypothetical protein
MEADSKQDKDENMSRFEMDSEDFRRYGKEQLLEKTQKI